jgi:hypothetical protein
MKLDTLIALTCACVLGLAITSFADTGDSDADGVGDAYDNCLDTPNPGQRDDHGDGYGNLCDGDVDDNCIIGLRDQALIGANHGASGPPWTSSTIASYDLDESGVVGISDVAIIGARWGAKPGPSGLDCQQDCSGDGPSPPAPTDCAGGQP